MKFRPTEFLNTPYRVSCYIKLYRKLFSCMRPILISSLNLPLFSALPGELSDVHVTGSTPTTVSIVLHGPRSDDGSPIDTYMIMYDGWEQTYRIKNTNQSGECNH